MTEADWSVVYRLISTYIHAKRFVALLQPGLLHRTRCHTPCPTISLWSWPRKNSKPSPPPCFSKATRSLYGRYWGSDGHYDALHFETCYYQGIDYCIDAGKQVFEPGTQGEHKISRGFAPETTWSAHWLAHPEFADAVSRYLDEEARHIDRYIDAVDSRTRPTKRRRTANEQPHHLARPGRSC